jgi:hypothetical protein
MLCQKAAGQAWKASARVGIAKDVDRTKAETGFDANQTDLMATHPPPDPVKVLL